VAKHRLIADESLQGSVDRVFDGVGSRDAPGPFEEVVVDFDESLGHGIRLSDLQGASTTWSSALDPVLGEARSLLDQPSPTV
jgi:hypothetical protein